VDKGGTEVWRREVGTGVMTGSELKGGAVKCSGGRCGSRNYSWGWRWGNGENIG